MSTVPKTAGLMLWEVVVVIMTRPWVWFPELNLAREAPVGAAAIGMIEPFCVRSTTDISPRPPGLTNARCSRGSKAICGFAPVFNETEATGQNCGPDAGAVPGMHPGLALLGSTLTIKPTFVEENTTSARFVKGSIPTAKGVGAVEPPLAGISAPRLTLPRTVAEDAEAIWSIVSVLSPLFTTAATCLET